jgi:tellurite resistance protein
MFLNKLEENEKVAFLTLAHHIARSDGDFSENEQNIIVTYCMEMQIEDINYNENSFNLNEILSVIKGDENQKILLLEIMALVYSDGLHQEEQKILDIIIEQYNISEALFIVYSQWSKSILSISNQGLALIRL